MSVHQKLGIILESKVVQKLNLEKNVFTKKWSPKLIFLNEFFFWKNSVDFWHWKLTLKVRFWHFLTNRNSSKDFFKENSLDNVDSWPKILLFWTHHLLWNSTTELMLIPTHLFQFPMTFSCYTMYICQSVFSFFQKFLRIVS